VREASRPGRSIGGARRAAETVESRLENRTPHGTAAVYPQATRRTARRTDSRGGKGHREQPSTEELLSERGPVDRPGHRHYRDKTKSRARAAGCTLRAGSFVETLQRKQKRGIEADLRAAQYTKQSSNNNRAIRSEAEKHAEQTRPKAETRTLEARRHRRARAQCDTSTPARRSALLHRGTRDDHREQRSAGHNRARGDEETIAARPAIDADAIATPRTRQG